MKFYKPLFSIVIILIQLIFTLKEYYDYVQWGKENPELDALLNRIFTDDFFFLSILIIGLLEMLTKPNSFKIALRIFLVLVVLSFNLSGFIPMNDFNSGVFNVAIFSSFIAFIIILWKVSKHIIWRLLENKASR